MSNRMIKANLNLDVSLTVKQLAEIIKQLPQSDRSEIASLLQENEETYLTKEQLLANVKEALEEVKLYKQGKIKLRTLNEFLDEV
jgi:hypothetical protein